MLQLLIVLAILATVVLVVSAPIRRARIAQGATAAGAEPATEPGGASFDEADRTGASEVAELEAARDAKYREIRDAELDHRTGKLSGPDFEAVDRGLRAEAVEILHELDRARSVAGDEERDPEPPSPAGAEAPKSSRI